MVPAFYVGDVKLPSQNKLFLSLRYDNDVNTWKSIQSFLSKQIDDSKIVKSIENHLKNIYESDEKTLSEVRLLTGHLREKNNSEDENNREASRVRQISSFLKDLPAHPRYLDIGCSEGKLTNAIVSYLKIKKEDAFACDVVPLRNMPSKFNFVLSQQDILPFSGQDFDLVTMFMCAHHFTDASKMFREAKRVLKKGGVLIIREHNVTDDPHDTSAVQKKIFLDIVHSLYECCFADETTPENFAKRYNDDPDKFARYRNILQWKEIAKSAGFKAKGVPLETKDRFFSFYQLFIT